jgi:hypothetical protein
MESAAKLTLAILLSTLGAIHFYWATGGVKGAGVAIPSVPGTRNRPLFTPGRGGTIAVGVLLLAGAGVATGQVLPAIQPILLRLIAAVFCMRAVGEFHYVGFFKRVKETPFATWDSRLFSPLSVALGLLALVGSGLFVAR